MAKYWKEHFESKNDVPSWPINATVEIIDIKSDVTYLISWATQRVYNPTLPPVGAFIFTTHGVEFVDYLAPLKVPMMVPSINSNIFDNQKLYQGPSYNYTFYMKPVSSIHFESLWQRIRKLESKLLSQSPISKTSYTPTSDGALTMISALAQPMN